MSHELFFTVRLTSGSPTQEQGWLAGQRAEHVHPAVPSAQQVEDPLHHFSQSLTPDCIYLNYIFTGTLPPPPLLSDYRCSSPSLSSSFSSIGRSARRQCHEVTKGKKSLGRRKTH